MSEENSNTDIDLGADLEKDTTQENQVSPEKEQGSEDQDFDLGKGIEADPEEAVSTPEKYDLKYSEELKHIKTDESFDGTLQSVFKEAKLTQEQAQIIADNLNKIDNYFVEKNQESIDNIYKGWKEGLSKNPLFMGQYYKESEAHIKTGLRYLMNAPEASEGFSQAIKETFYNKSESNPNGNGLVNNKIFAEMLRHFGKALSQDNAILGNTAPKNEKNWADKFYDKE